MNPWFCLSIYLSMNLSIFARSLPKRSFKTSLPCPALGHFSRWPRAHTGSSAQMTHAHPSGWRRERYDRPRIPPSGDAHSLADVVRGLVGHLTVLPTFCIRRGFAAGGGGDEWPRRGNWHHRRAVSRGRRHIPDATICLGRPTDPTSRAHAFPGPMSFQTACSRSCPPQDRCVRRLAQSWPNHACQIRARVAWLMPSDRSAEVRPHLPRRDLLTSPRAIDVQGAPQAPSPSSAKPMLAQRQGSAPARTPRSDPTICSRD